MTAAPRFPRHAWRRSGLVLAATGLALAYLALAGSASFQVDHNDFWGIAFYAGHLSTTDPASLHNGFYPIGYPAMLRAVGGISDLGRAVVLNAVLAAAMVLVAARLGLLIGGRLAAGITALLVVSYPLVFRYATVPGPDIGAAALCCLGALVLAQSLPADPPTGTLRLVVAGIALGGAALFRYHALVLAVGLLLGFVLVRGRWREALPAWGGLAVVYTAQVVVNLAAGRGPLDTAQAFNVYRMVNDVPWHRAAEIPIPSSWFAIVAVAPGRFLSAYAESFGRLLPLLLPSAVALAPGWPPKVRAAGGMVAVAIALFIVVVAAGASSRAALVVLPICFAQIGALIGAVVTAPASDRAERRVRRAARLTALAVAAAYLLLWVREDAGLLAARRMAHDRNVRLQEMMRARGLERSAEVFTTDFSFYLPGLAPAMPYTHGGWPQVAVYGFSRAFPPLCTRSFECFAADAARHGVRYLVLGPDAATLMPELGEIYRDPHARPTAHPLGTAGDLKAFALAPAPPSGDRR